MKSNSEFGSFICIECQAASDRAPSFPRPSYAGSFPIKLAYGRDGADPLSDRYIRVAEEAMVMVGDMLFPGAILLNAFPTCERTFLPRCLFFEHDENLSPCMML